MSCPICGKPTDPRVRPFCSRRCKELDLGRWFSEDYRVPVVETEELEDEESPDPRAPNDEEER